MLSAAPNHIPALILPPEELETLIYDKTGAAPDLISARGVPDTKNPDPSLFDRRDCNLVVIEVGFCQEFGLRKKLSDKTEKYAPLVAALQRL